MPDLSRAANLARLDLSSNRLLGTFPTFILGLTKLTYVSESVISASGATNAPRSRHVHGRAMFLTRTSSHMPDVVLRAGPSSCLLTCSSAQCRPSSAP